MKKNNFSEHLKKSTAHLNNVKGLSQPTGTGAPAPGQKTIVTCIRNQNKKLKDQLDQFHADWESYRNMGLKINRNEVIFTAKVP